RQSLSKPRHDIMDFKKWVRRVVDFHTTLPRLGGRVNVHSTVAPPMSLEEVNRLADKLRLGVPLQLRRFLTEGSANCACTYLWWPPPKLEERFGQVFPSKGYIWGWANLCNAAKFEEYQIGCHDWGSAWEDSPEQRTDMELWMRSVPFSSLGSGDYLALDVGTDPNDLSVAYLSHDGYGWSRIVARSFEQFLTDWQELYYVGVDILLGAGIMELGSGFIDPRSEKARLLARLIDDAFERWRLLN